MYGKNHHNIVISLQLIKINGKKNKSSRICPWCYFSFACEGGERCLQSLCKKSWYGWERQGSFLLYFLTFPSFHEKEFWLLCSSVQDYSLSSWLCCVLCSETQLCPTLCDPMDCSTPGSVHGDSPSKNDGMGCHALLQKIFPTQDWSQVSCTEGGFFTIWAPREAQEYSSLLVPSRTMNDINIDPVSYSD